MAEYNRPVPGVTPDSKEYWEGCRRHELLIQRCRECGHHRFYPGPICQAFDCLSMDFDWVQSSGKGTVYTLTVVARAPNEMWADLAPYALVLIELDEGPVIFSRAVDIPAFDVRIGDADGGRLRGPDGRGDIALLPAHHGARGLTVRSAA